MANWNSGQILISGKIRAVENFIRRALSFPETYPNIKRTLECDDTHFFFKTDGELYLNNSDRIYLDLCQDDYIQIFNSDPYQEISIELSITTPWGLDPDEAFSILSEYDNLTFNICVDEDSDDDTKYYYRRLIISKGNIVKNEIETEPRYE